jgi:transposase-like protein
MANPPIVLDALFKGRHYEWEIIILCVRWYVPRYLLEPTMIEILQGSLARR